jgi:hypothetical protein
MDFHTREGPLSRVKTTLFGDTPLMTTRRPGGGAIRRSLGHSLSGFSVSLVFANAALYLESQGPREENT